jgi:site-specific DNA-cytosine methylase
MDSSKKTNRDVLSLFDGISTLQYVLRKTGRDFDNYYASEIDKHAIAVTQDNFPETAQLGNVRNVNGRDFEGVWLLSGASPCQNLSVANIGREGLKGEQSKLFYDFVRVKEEARPVFWIYENVASMSSKDRDCISAALGSEPYNINSKIFSVQDRRRLYWTNIPVDSVKGISNSTIISDIVEEGYDNKTIQDKYENETVIEDLSKRMVGYIKNKNRGNRIYSSNGKAITLTASSGGIGAKTGLYLINGVVRRLSPIEAEACQGLPANYTASVSESQRYKQVGNGWNVQTIEFLLKNLN